MLKKNFHNGGTQLPLFMPDTTWSAPEELPALTNVEEVVVDCETKDDGLRSGRGPGWATKAGYVCGLAIAWKEEANKSIYIPIQHEDSSNFPKEQVRRWLRHQFRRPIHFTFHNAAYDIGWINADFGVAPPAHIDDTGCMAYMIDEQRLSYQLGQLCKWQGITGKTEGVLREAAIAMGIDPKNELYKLPARFVGDYGEGDGYSTLALSQALRPLLEKEEVVPAYQLEMDLVPMVHAMRQRGICIDIDCCERLFAQFKHQSQLALDDITDKLGTTTGIDDIRSSKWLEKVFTDLKIDFPRTATGKGSFEAKWMKKHKHWLPGLITRAKSREDAAEKFVKGYLMDFCDSDARIHPTIHQYRGERHGEDDDDRGGGTKTYRFSYADPPLQQIPHRDEEMVEIRDAFIGEDGEKWLSVDYSQQEFRLMVHYASLIRFNGVPGLPGAHAAAQRYKDDPDTDFHSMVAEMTGLDRKPAKDCNFAKAYGAGVEKFSIMIGKSKAEAEAIMQQYDERLPFIKMMGKHCQQTAESRGFIKLLDGARIHFNFWFAGWREHGFSWNNQNFSSHTSYEECLKRIQTKGHPWFGERPRRSGCNKAMNALIQGGAARMTKLAMRDVWRAGYCPTLQIHDELCFSIKHEKEAHEIATLMRDTVNLNVPMKVDIAIGDSWYEH